MKNYRMFKSMMGVLLTVGIVVSGIPCRFCDGNTAGILAVQAAEADVDGLTVDSALTAKQQRKITFHACFYANRYPDVKSAYGYDAAALYHHFLNWGIKEGRCASPVFDASYYLEVHPDLKAAYGNDYVEAYRHWLQYGYLEDRESSSYYNGVYYRQCYADLASMNNLELMHHYLSYAAQEGRIANTNGLLLDDSLMKAYYPTYAGGSDSIIAALDSLGIDSGKANRTKIALANGFENYLGTVEQNALLLNLLKQGLLVDPKAMEDSVRFEKEIAAKPNDYDSYRAAVNSLKDSFDNERKICVNQINRVKKTNGTYYKTTGLCNISSITTLCNRKLFFDGLGNQSKFTVEDSIRANGCNISNGPMKYYSGKSWKNDGYCFSGETGNWWSGKHYTNAQGTTYTSVKLSKDDIDRKKGNLSYEQFLVQLLMEHPEGVCLRNKTANHVCVITDFVMDGNSIIFYAQDPVNQYTGVLSNTYLYRQVKKAGESIFKKLDAISYLV